jgi:hypothetical protein
MMLLEKNSDNSAKQTGWGTRHREIPPFLNVKLCPVLTIRVWINLLDG